MNVNFDKVSVVQWSGPGEKHRCGYCKNSRGSISDGMWAETLTVQDYQDLIDRGWRRSGKYCYKPIMDKTCCPQYTIKCDTSNFMMSKSQKKVLNKFNRYLNDGVMFKKDDPTDTQNDRSEQASEASHVNVRPNINLANVIEQSPSYDVEDRLAGGEPHEIEHLEKQPVIQTTPATLVTDGKSSNNKVQYKEGDGKDPNKPPCKKAKLIRLERKKEKLLNKGDSDVKSHALQKQKTLEEFIEGVSQNPKVKLKLHLVPTSEPNLEWERTKGVEFDLYAKYQTIIHNDPPHKLNMENFSCFLVESPLKPEQFPNGSEGPGYGSFHQQYWLDGKLIAVGVIDILPKCVSSVYFFYDPDYRSLTLGTLGAIREIHFTRSLTSTLPELKWYYMGFYIHSCPKMRYKGKLSPSYLLCPESYSWIPIEKCLPLLDRQKYSRLNTDLDALDSNCPKKKDLAEMKVVFKNTVIPFKIYKKYSKNASMFEDVIVLIGAKCTKTLVFWT